MIQTDVIIVGAGASGLMCAITAGKRGQNVIVLDHAKKPGTKILMSGGGRCNFTNLNISPDNYISNNPHFCKSALKQYTQWDFIELVRSHKIQFEERAHGQLFCINSSHDILNMLIKECDKFNIKFNMNCNIKKIEKNFETENFENSKTADNQKKLNSVLNNTVIKTNSIKNKNHFFRIFIENNIVYQCRSVVIATGGLSIPSSGATPFGYQIAKQFGIDIVPPHAGLVPLTLNPEDKKISAALSGIALNAIVTIGKRKFRENILFTHRGLSGPAILQISSYWNQGESITLNLLPELNLFDWLVHQQQQLQGKNDKNINAKKLKSILSELLPKRLIIALIPEKYCEAKLGEIPHKELKQTADKLQSWLVRPDGTEGYRTSEVTVGGVDCDYISSKTMESRHVKGLFFIGEVLDVTGWLGGYNLQWAWSSGWCAGMAV
ncbi:MAG: NAD(P)/FAD-dependent oxidoreductase [Desulfamplus sp.]|nr:NAD(P)/FAD-dependent oxidoreductase [Desulfamplus sp.]